jgi:hypothetical protein
VVPLPTLNTLDAIAVHSFHRFIANILSDEKATPNGLFGARVLAEFLARR